MFAQREESRHHGQPIYLFLFKGTEQAGPIPDFDAGAFGPYAYCDGEEPITRDGITYIPWPMEVGDITSTGNFDKSDISITLARGTQLESHFIGYPPSQVVNVIIFRGHHGDSPTVANFPAAWVGRVSSPIFERDTVMFNCVPVSSMLQRPGLRRHYQLACPHVLYGSQCRADREAATSHRQVTVVSGNTLQFDLQLPRPPGKYRGGLVQWTADGAWNIRTIISVNAGGTSVGVRGNLAGLVVGGWARMSLGCNRLQGDCRDLHNNILNYGGQPHIPLENPLSQKNVFY